MAPQSGVWAHFTKIANKQKVKCNLCSKELSYCNSTTSLGNHLLVKHSINVKCSTSDTPSGSAKRPRIEENVDNPEDIQTQGTSFAEASSTSQKCSQPQKSLEQQKSLEPQKTSKQQEHNCDIAVAGRSENLVEWATRAKAYAKGGKKKLETDDALLYMIVHDNLSLNTPEKEGFRIFCNKLNPHYKVPCENTTTSALAAKYKLLKLKVGDILKNYKNIVLTTDLWTEIMTVRSFLGLTAHFAQGTEIISITIGVRLMSERKTSANLQELIAQILAEWKIDLKQVRAIVTDRGANIKKACEDLFNNEPGKHLPCLAHIVNTIATNAIGLYKKSSKDSPPEVDAFLPVNYDSDDESNNLDEIILDGSETCLLKATIMKVKRLVTFFRQSEVAAKELKNLQNTEWEKLDIECLKLIQEVKTRWNSVYLMIERYLHLNELVGVALTKVSKQNNTKKKPPPDLNSEEIVSLKEVKNLLHPLYLVTLELSSEKHVTISKCIPLINMLKTAITAFEATDPISFNLKSKIIAEINDFFGSIERNKIYTVATMLDPRFKKLHFRDPRTVANTMKNISELMDKKLADIATTKSTNSDKQKSVSSSESTNSSQDVLWIHHDTLVSLQPNYSNRADGDSLRELKLFLSRPVSPRESNPLEEWETLKEEFPILYRVAMDYLTIPATSVASERLFSKAGIRLTKLRNRLSGPHLEQTLVMNSIPKSLWFNQ